MRLKIFNIEDENKEIQIKFKEFLKEKLNIYISQNLRKFIEIKKYMRLSLKEEMLLLP
jgi:hypothetical protein